MVGRFLAAASRFPQARGIDAMTGTTRQNGTVRVDIGVCTYRRPMVAETLRSLGAISVPENVRVRVLVADNDVNPSARDLVYALAAELPFEIVYVHCPASNISIARNACLDHATGDFLAFMDDDSTVAKDWLAELLKTAQHSGADAVLGPVRAVYPDAAPDWMQRGEFHSTAPVWVDGEIRTGYSGNVLLNRASPRVTGRRFNLELGQTGGEDTEYFAHLYQAGGVFSFAPGALAYEPVTDERARFSWLARRRFRVGQTHGRLLGQETRAAGLVPQVALAAAKSAWCFVVTVALVLDPVERNRYALRGIMHAGVVGGLVGMREIRQYGAAPARGHGNAA